MKEMITCLFMIRSFAEHEAQKQQFQRKYLQEIEIMLMKRNTGTVIKTCVENNIDSILFGSLFRSYFLNL